MTREDHLKLFKEYVGKPKEELDAKTTTEARLVIK